MLLCYNLAILFFAIISLICSAGAKGKNVPYTTLFHTAFVPRGGGVSTIIDGKKIGVIDLRPKPADPDSVILLHEDDTSNDDDDNIDSTFDVVQEAVFPTTAIHQHDDEIAVVDIDEMMDEQAASSHSIGNLCSTVYLIIAYDFENGKTVLHRSFGGTKLMAFVDGVRNRLHGMMNPANQAGGGSDDDVTTKLIILLIPSSPSSTTTLLSNWPSSGTKPDNILLANTNPLLDKLVLDLTNTDSNSDWDASGATYLVDKLSEAFALGGEEYQNTDPFEVEFVGVFNNVGDLTKEKEEEKDPGDDTNSSQSEVIVRHIVCSLRGKHCNAKGIGDTVLQTSSAEDAASSSSNDFQDQIRRTYEAAGGVADNVNFQ